MSRFNVDGAQPGFCTLCHTEIAEFDGFVDFGNIKRPKVKFLKSNFRQGMVTLSDGTSMTISLCDKCIDFGPEKTAELYASEINGWRNEITAMHGHVNNHKALVDHLETQKTIYITDREDVKWSAEEKAMIPIPVGKEINFEKI